MPHHDKKFNKMTKSRMAYAAEIEAPLLLFNFGAECVFDLTRPSDGTLIRQIPFASGDFIYVPGFVNGLLKHSASSIRRPSN